MQNMLICSNFNIYQVLDKILCVLPRGYDGSRNYYEKFSFFVYAFKDFKNEIAFM